MRNINFFVFNVLATIWRRLQAAWAGLLGRAPACQRAHLDGGETSVERKEYNALLLAGDELKMARAFIAAGGHWAEYEAVCNRTLKK
jgi:hypothetical protein